MPRRAQQGAQVVYSRAWSQGVATRTIEPYRLVQTRRGWEVDAGPPEADGALRTFLLSNIRAAEVLDDTFDLPADLSVKLAAQRPTTSVRVSLPHDARWAADFFTEDVERRRRTTSRRHRSTSRCSHPWRPASACSSSPPARTPGCSTPPASSAPGRSWRRSCWHTTGIPERLRLDFPAEVGGSWQAAAAWGSY